MSTLCVRNPATCMSEKESRIRSVPLLDCNRFHFGFSVLHEVLTIPGSGSFLGKKGDFGPEATAYQRISLGFMLVDMQIGG